MTSVRTAMARVFREERTRVLAVLIRQLGDFELAEDALQDAFTTALTAWETDGVPANGAAWILTTARRRALDQARRRRTFERIAPEVARAGAVDPEPGDTAMPEDDRLRLVFTCCHPALDPASRVALTLQTVGGLTAREIARAFLVPESAMAQRLVRVKRKIRDAGIPYRVPPPELLPERIDDVRTVVYLVFNEGYAATDGASLARTDLCEEAIRLARLLRDLGHDPAESEGLLALLLLHHARRAARTGGAGEFVPLDEQDRRLWDSALVREGTQLLDVAVARRTPGPYQLQAAISALHCAAARAGDTDWRQIALLYDRLRTFDESPVVELNAIVARSFCDGPAVALPLLEELGRRHHLESYQPFHAARADLLRRVGRFAAAREAYDRAIESSRDDGERRFLERRRAECAEG